MSFRRRAVEADADAVGEDPALAELAEQQRKAALALLAKVDNLDSALVKLGEADFYGLAALEVCGSLETRMRWEVIEPWHLYQPLPNGPVFYNEQADTIPQRAEELERESVIIRTAPAMHLPVMFLISRMSHSEEQWDAFIDTYGLPNIFFELPAAMDERRALELDAIVKRLTGDGRGTMPNGTKIQTVETQQRDGTLFEQRGKWCRDAIISLVLGGTLTMETAPNSGTLAGNAHADSFAELCEGSAAGIGAAVDEQFLRPLLRKMFPHQPILVSFSYRPVDAEDAQQVAQTLATLSQAGWKVSAETASEMLGFEVEAAPAAESTMYNGQSTNPMFGAAAPREFVGNRAEGAGNVAAPTDEAPLTQEELDALALVQNALDPDVLRKKAADIAGRLYEAMQTGKQGEEVANEKREVTGTHPDGSPCTAQEKCPLEGASKGDAGLTAKHPSTWVAIIAPPTITPEEGKARLLKGETATDPRGEIVKLDETLLKHWYATDEESVRKGKQPHAEDDIKERCANLPLIKKVIEDPHEIRRNDNGSITYLAKILDQYKPKGEGYMIAFTKAGNDALLETYNINDRLSAGRREGELIWVRPEGR